MKNDDKIDTVIKDDAAFQKNESNQIKGYSESDKNNILMEKDKHQHLHNARVSPVSTEKNSPDSPHVSITKPSNRENIGITLGNKNWKSKFISSKNKIINFFRNFQYSYPEKNLKNNFWSLKQKVQLRQIGQQSRYLLQNFWPHIIATILLLMFFHLWKIYSYNFRTDQLTKYVKASVHAGNAVFINKKFLLTSYNSLYRVCNPTEPGQQLRAFIILSGETVRVKVHSVDKVNNLLLLMLDPADAHYADINNFALFPDISDGNYNYLKAKVLISKRVNNPNGEVYGKYTINGIGSHGYTVSSRDLLRPSFGEAVLNERLELIGITDGSSKNNSSFGIDINIIEQGRIKKFLKTHRVYYYKNTHQVDLHNIINYRGSINAELICYIREKPLERIIKIYR
jgi:hypothetical protein